MPISNEEMRKIKDDLLEAINKGGTLNEIKIQLARFVSHLESEQRISVEHGKLLNDHQLALYGNAERDGLQNKVKTIEEYMKERKRQNSAILLGIVGLLLKAAWEIITKHQ